MKATVFKLLIVVLGPIALLGVAFILRPMAVASLVYPIIESIVIDDFIGLTTDGEIREGLYSIEPTGVSTQEVVTSAETFLATLSEEQRHRASFPVDDIEWQKWSNIHIAPRQGVGFLEFDDKQATAAFGLIKSGLSRRGYQTARNIMRLEGYLAELTDKHREFGEKRYWITIMGEPSTTEPWGWQVDGHHLVINFFVLGDQVVMTPTFMGSEPTNTNEGVYAGTRILDEELAKGLDLINALPPAQQDEAIVSKDKIRNDNKGELWQDNIVLPYQGLLVSSLDDRNQALARELIRLYTGKMRQGHDEIKFNEILEHWDETYFSWIGGTAEDSVFYYRFHSPVVLIEYDHQTPREIEDSAGPSRDHVHTVVRTPNGNDYGKDLLKQHRARHHN